MKIQRINSILSSHPLRSIQTTCSARRLLPQPTHWRLFSFNSGWTKIKISRNQQKLAEAVKKQPWDPSIQAMAALPDVVKRLQSLSKDPKHPTRTILTVGNDNWPFPIPIVELGGKWYFDTSEGRGEILLDASGETSLMRSKYVEVS